MVAPHAGNLHPRVMVKLYGPGVIYTGCPVFMFVGTEGNAIPCGRCCGCGLNETLNEIVLPSLIFATASSGVSASTAICFDTIHSIVFLLWFPKTIVLWVAKCIPTSRTGFQDIREIVD